MATEICLMCSGFFFWPPQSPLELSLDRIYEQINVLDGQIFLSASILGVADKKSKNVIVTIMFRFFLCNTHAPLKVHVAQYTGSA